MNRASDVPPEVDNCGWRPVTASTAPDSACVNASSRVRKDSEGRARQTISQFKGTDTDLVKLFERAREAIQAYLDGKGLPRLIEQDEQIIEEDEEDEELLEPDAV